MTSGRLLLVDDDPSMAALIGMLARRAGLTVTCCPDVDSVWSALFPASPLPQPLSPAERGEEASDVPELVLLDINLPIKSGLEFLRMRRQMMAPCRFGVALFCQPSMIHDVAAGWKEGADYLIAKDLVTRPSDWQKRVTEILEHLRGQVAIPSLGWPDEGDGPLLYRWGEVLNEALADTSLRSLAVEVIEEVLWRALIHGFRSEAQRAWFVPYTGRVCLTTPLPGDSDGVNRCFASLIDQVWCLLGSGPCAQLVLALRAAVNRRHKR
jgi:DNA-binding response OmpR family regulator